MKLAAHNVLLRFGAAGKEKDVKAEEADDAIDGTVMQKTETGNLRAGNVEASDLVNTVLLSVVVAI